MTKILLAEDDPMIAEIYQKKFKSDGLEVEVASTGKEVLNKALKGDLALILLDLVLPEMSGFEILKELKQSGKYNPSTKVIIFSNLSDDSDLKKATELGADGFISKTQFSPSELVEQIKRKTIEFEEREKNIQRQNGDSPKPEGTKKRILLIEDEDVFIELFGKKLEDDGYEVEFAKNGAWGLKEAEAKEFDIIITDMVMPAMTGAEIVTKLKDSEKNKNKPIIVLSASVQEEESKEVEKMGINAFFVKTRINPSDLSRKVQEILGEN